MAIKVGGTEVVDNNRQLKNIASVDATTVAALGVAGVGGGGSALEATADGNISIGDFVTLNSNGTVSSINVQNVLSSLSSAWTTSTTIWYNDMIYLTARQKFIVVYRDSTNNYGMAVAGSFSGTTISWDTPVVVASENAYYQTICDQGIYEGRDDFLFSWSNYSNNGRASILRATHSGSQFNFGNRNYISANGGYDMSLAFSGGMNAWVCVYRDANDSYKAYYRIISRVGSGTTISIGSGNAAIYSTQADTIALTSCGETNVVAMIADRTSNPKKVVGVVLSPTSANFVNVGSVQTIVSGNTTTDVQQGLAVTGTKKNIDNNGQTVAGNGEKRTHAVLIPDYNGALRIIPFYVTGTTINLGSAIQVTSSTSGDCDIGWDEINGRYLVINAGQIYLYKPNAATAATASVSLETSFSGGGVGSQYNAVADINAFSGSYVTNTLGQAWVGNQKKGQYVSASSNVSNYIGCASEATSSGSTAKILVLGGISENQSGLSTNSTYYIDDLGNISTSAVSGREIGKALNSTKLLLTTSGIT